MCYSLLRNIISLFSDLQQTAAHGISAAIQVSSLVERIKSLDVSSYYSVSACADRKYLDLRRFVSLRFEPEQPSFISDSSSNLGSKSTCN